MHKRVPQKGLSAMEKRIPKNEKYSHVQATLDTGLTVTKVKYVTAKEYAKRRDEIFFRITTSQLYELYNEYEATEYESITETANRGNHGAYAGTPNNEALRIVTHTENDSPIYSKPYLIFDVREMDEYQTCHLLQARTYPYTMMRRDQMHPDLYKFRNKPETLIIIYCNDEKISRDAAKLLVDRGTDNIYLITGGLQEFSMDFPAFIEGIPPSPPRDLKGKKPSSSMRTSQGGLGRIIEDQKYDASESDRAIGFSSALNANSLKRLGGKSSNIISTSRSTNRDGRSESGRSTNSHASNMSVAESVISKATARKGKF
eukprot:gene11237-15078_t